MFVAILAVSIVLAILIPIPPIVVDFLIIFNFAFSILILRLTVLVPKPTDFYVFPPLLLLATIYRLSLNIASTRLILLSASQPFGAGLVILTFGTLGPVNIHANQMMVHTKLSIAMKLRSSFS